MKYSSLGSVKEETVLQEYEWKFDYSTGSCNVSYDVKEVAELDVYHTYYRTPSATSSKNTFDEIHTVYFSIPDEYTKYYSKLYSVASTYTKKQTNPIMIGNNPILKEDDINGVLTGLNRYSIMSSDYYYLTDSDIGATSGYHADTMLNVPGYTTGKLAEYHPLDDTCISFGEIGSYFYCDKTIIKPEDLSATEEEFLDFVDHVENELSYAFYDIFYSSELIPWSEKTIEDSFDSIAYANRISGDLRSLINAYGTKTAFQFWWHRKNPEKFQELCEKYLVNVNAQNLTDVQNLLLCDTQVREDANALSNQEFSDKYLIDIDDVSSFKNYLNTHSNVILYRFDVVEYYSDEVSLFEPNYDTNFVNEIVDDYRYALVQMYAYFGFQVIDVAFNDEGNFVSLAVNSHPQNFASDPGLEEDEPPIEWDPKPDEFFDDLKNNANNLKGKIAQGLIRGVIIAISFLVICIGVSGIVKGLFSVSSKKKR